MKHPNKRRFVLQSLAASLVWVALPRALKLSGASALAATSLGSAVPVTAGLIQKAIPASGELLPVIGMGSARTFDVREKSIKMNPLGEVLRLFFQHGGRLIDSSPMYGRSEAVLGELLAKVPDKSKLFAATKVWIDGKDQGIAQMHQSEQRMKVERFDLIQIHNLRDWRTHLDTLREWKAQQRLRYIGITTSHGRFHSELEQILTREKVDFLQLTYNIGNRDVEARLLPIAKERGIAVIVNRPFQRGSLFSRVKGKPLPEWSGDFQCRSWGQFFLKFAVSHPAVTCAIPATSKPKHMSDNMGAGFGRLPDASERRAMIEYFKTL